MTPVQLSTNGGASDNKTPINYAGLQSKENATKEWNDNVTEIKYKSAQELEKEKLLAKKKNEAILEAKKIRIEQLIKETPTVDEKH